MWFKKRSKKNTGKLSKKDKEFIFCVVSNEFPIDYGIDSSLWTRTAIKSLILKCFNTEISLNSISKLAKKIGLVQRRPEKYEVHRNEKLIDDFVQQGYYNTILKEALKENALLLFLDETAIKQGPNAQRGYAPLGVPSHVLHLASTASHSVASLLIAMSFDGDMYFKLETETVTSETFVDFLKDINKNNTNRKIFIVLDNSRVHKSHTVYKYIKEQRKIKLFFLPPYAPDINPVELFNNALKSNIRHKKPMNTEYLIEFTYDFMYEKTKDKSYIKSFFKRDKVSYTTNILEAA